MTGLEFEDLVEELLIKYNKTYKREGKRINYGHRASKGKYDFELTKTAAAECKAIGTLNNLTVPGINPKTHKPYTKPKIPSHQLKALRQFKGTGYLLIHESDSNMFYALNMQEFDRFIIDNDMPRTLKGIDEHEIELEIFLKGLE